MTTQISGKSLYFAKFIAAPLFVSKTSKRLVVGINNGKTAHILDFKDP